MLEISLFAVLALVLALPVLVPSVENNFELFFLIAGLSAVTCSHIFGTAPAWSLPLVRSSVTVPFTIAVAMIAAGLLFHFFRECLTEAVVRLEHRVGSRIFCFILVVSLGLVSSVITAVMSAMILVEVVSALKLDKTYENKLVVLSCYSIGLGAVLTPAGEPLSTICISKLAGQPYHADFFFLLRALGPQVFAGVIGLALYGALTVPSVTAQGAKDTLCEKIKPRLRDIFIYAGRVYVFIMALVYLGAGFKPVIDGYVIKLPYYILYWLNMVSALLDNATLTAAEISPLMNILQIKCILMGLLISGGMLIPGNVPNIIAASRLNINSWEWAKAAVPTGLLLLLIYFGIFFFRGYPG
jgi:predicted cation transporter